MFKKISKRVLSLFLVLMVLFVSACSQSGSNATATSTGKETIIVGTVGSGEPYSMINSDGKWTGMKSEMWAEVEKRTNYKVEMKQVGDHSSIFGELADRKN